ncbi:MAG: hypothetical protein IJF14_04465, partial [Clostridia bacterium]|nr:hypothetical protein [Clostridia bacterium]
YVAMAITNNDSDIYSGPGEDYEIIDHIVAGETVGILSDEGNWCYIECPAGSLSFSSESLCGYIPTSVLDFNEPIPEPDPDPVPDFVTTTLDDTDTYSGPSSEWYEYCDHLPAGETITILWKEGDYYYVEATFMIYHAGSEETGDWYEEGTKRMYIHQNYVGDFTGTVPDLSNASYLEVDFTEVADCYTGPGTNYEPDGTIYPDGPHNLFGNKIENGFAFIETVGDENLGKRVWVDSDKVILPEDEEPDTPETPDEPTPDPDPPTVPEIVAYTTADADTYTGPDAYYYDYADHLPVNQELKVLWKEGDYYYVEATFMIYHPGSDETGDWYEEGTKRMYIHEDYVSDFTGTAPDLTNASYLEVDFTENVTCYTGPGIDYETDGVSYPDGPHTLFAGKIENGFAFIDTAGDEMGGKRVWVQTDKIIGLPEDEEPDTPSVDTNVTITAVANTNAVVYHGPDVTVFSDIDAIKNGETVSVLWKERDCYYVDCPASAMHNVTKKMCGYVECSKLSNLSAAPADLGIVNCNTIELSPNTPSFMGPGIGYNDAGTVDYNTTVKNVGNIVKNGFILVENENSNTGVTKRAWVPVNSRATSSTGSGEITSDGVSARTGRREFVYYGPDETSYEYCDYIRDDKEIKVLWQEGDYYYAECIVTVYKDGEYKDGKKRFYIHKNALSTLPDVDLRSDITDNTEISFAPGTMGYTGPGDDYEETEYIAEDTYVTRVNVYVENGFVFVKCQRNGEFLKRVWIPITAWRDVSIDDLVVATGETNKVTTLMWGPQNLRGNTYVTGDTIANGISVDILWYEGDYYYVRYTSGGRKRCGYMKKEDVELNEGSNASAIYERELDTSPDSYRYVTEDRAYTYPYPSNESHSETSYIDRLETMRELGVKIGYYTLVEYDIKKDEKDVLNPAHRKRAWVNQNDIRPMPKPDVEVYLKTNGDILEERQPNNAKYIYLYLHELGFGDNPIFAILGNVMQECTMNPANWEVRYSTEDGYGLFQFTPAKKYLNRAVKDGLISEAEAEHINNYANGIVDSYSAPVDNTRNLMQSQLECMIWGCFAGSQWSNPGTYNNVYSGKFSEDYTSEDSTPKKYTIYDFMNSNYSIEELTIIFHDFFEKSNDVDDVEDYMKGEAGEEGSGHLSGRIKEAISWQTQAEAWKNDLNIQ